MEGPAGAEPSPRSGTDPGSSAYETAGSALRRLRHAVLTLPRATSPQIASWWLGQRLNEHVTTDVSASRSVPVDAARALSLLVVVAFHMTMFGVSGSTLDGGLPGGIFRGAWIPVSWVLSWFAMVMPLFFVVSGYANAHVLDRQHSEGGSYGTWLVERGRRLLGPLVLYVGVWASLGTLLAWAGMLDTARAGTLALTKVLWFLLIYLVLICVAPVMYVAHDRWGVWVFVVLGVGAVGLDAVRFVLGGAWAGSANFVLVWVFVHQLGVAYHRGWWRTGPVARVWLTLGGALAALVALLFVVGYYPRSAVALGDGDIANLMPPTAAMAALALAQTAVLALVERRVGPALGRSRRLKALLRPMNSLAMTIYLWHGPIIALGIWLLVQLAQAFPPAAVVLLGRPTLIALAVPLMFGLIPLIGVLERRLVPPSDAESRSGLAAASMALLVLGFGLVYQTGILVHPSAPRATLGVVCLAAGVLVFRVAAMRRTGSGVNR